MHCAIILAYLSMQCSEEKECSVCNSASKNIKLKKVINKTNDQEFCNIDAPRTSGK